MNRAVDGDVVAVKVFDESEWKCEGDEVLDQDGESCLRFDVLPRRLMEMLK